MKRILNIHGSADVGGTELRAFYVASRLKTKFEIATLFHSRPGAMMERYRSENLVFWNERFPWIPRAMQHIRQFQPDIIHMYGLEVNVLWRPILFWTGYRRLVGHIGGLSNLNEDPTWLRIFLDRLTYRLLRVYIVNSSTVAERMVHYGFERDRLHILRNGIVVPAQPPSPRSNLVPIILSVGNLRPVKGHKFLVEALSLLAQRGIPFEARIFGYGPDRDALQDQAKHAGIADRIHFRGHVDNAQLEAELSQGDVFALLSLSEGISGAAMEAMAAGLPVVATRVGGMPELVGEGEQGFLVPPRATEMAADRLQQLLSDTPLRQRMSQAAYLKVRNQFNLDRTVSEYEKLYNIHLA